MNRQDEINSMVSDLMVAQSLTQDEALEAIVSDGDITLTEARTHSGVFNKILKQDINEAAAKMIAGRVDSMLRADDEICSSQLLATLAKNMGIPIGCVNAAWEDFNTLDRHF